MVSNKENLHLGRITCYTVLVMSYAITMIYVHYDQIKFYTNAIAKKSHLAVYSYVACTMDLFSIVFFE